MSDTVRVEDRAGGRWITLARPPRNVLDRPTIGHLREALSPLPARRDLKAVVLRSAVPGTFSAGVDVADHAAGRVDEMLEGFHAVFRLLDRLPQVTLAAVDGECLGGGCELAVFCDVVVATPRSRFGLPEIALGCFPPVAAAVFPRLVGRAACELVLGGDSVAAAEAARVGLINRVVDDVDAAAVGWVERAARRSGAVLALARRAVRRGAEGPWEEALSRAEEVYRRELMTTRDAREGVRAFLEKREPRWTDD